MQDHPQRGDGRHRHGAADLETRHAYDTVADDYAALLPDMTTEAPLDRAVLDAFVEMMKPLPPAPVADVGCGTGRVTRHLQAAGLPMVGLDLSPRMASVARGGTPCLPFAVADACALPLRAGVLGGLVAWYSLINLSPDLMRIALDEFARVTRSGAPVLIAFQAGEGQRVDRPTAYGHCVPITYFRHSAEDVERRLVPAGLALHAIVHREPSLAHETTPQAFLLAIRS